MNNIEEGEQIVHHIYYKWKVNCKNKQSMIICLHSSGKKDLLV